MNSSGMIILGIVSIAVGLLIIIYGVRIARIYAVISALGLAVSVGVGLTALLATVLHMAGNMLIPILAALVFAVLLLRWVARAYITYLKIYAVLGMIKIGVSIVALCLVLLHIQGGIIVLIALLTTAGVICFIIKGIAKWGHLLYMIGIITDGALISIAGGVMLGGASGRIGFTVLIAILSIPLLIWAGLYRECWRQQITFPGIKSW